MLLRNTHVSLYKYKTEFANWRLMAAAIKKSNQSKMHVHATYKTLCCVVVTYAPEGKCSDTFGNTDGARDDLSL